MKPYTRSGGMTQTGGGKKKLGVSDILAVVLPMPMPTDAQSAPSNNQVLARLVVACHVMTRTSCFAGNGTRGGRR